MFELELEYPIYNNSKWEYLIEDNIIKALTPAGDQLFRIYHKSKNLTSIKVNARHIFYDLLDNLVEEIDIRGLSGKDALKKAMDNLAYKTNFKYFSNISWRNNIYLDDETGDIENKNPIEVLFTLISIYGGELRRDNFNFLWLENIGQNNGVVISYGKNIKGIEEDLNRDSVITRIKPVGQDGLTLDEKYIDSPYISNYPHPKIKVIEFNDCNDYESLRRAAKEHYKKSKCDLPVLNYKVDFIELSKTEEYQNYSCLETLNLGDIVTVKHKILKIDVKQKVIKYKYDCLRNRYIGIELGSFKENLNKIFEETDDNLDKLDLDIKDTNKRLKENEKRFKSSIEKTDSRITLAIEEIDKTNVKLELTANSITSDVEDKINKTNSRIEQTANSLSSEINNTKDNLNSKIEQTANSITSEVNARIKDIDGKVRDCSSKIDQTAESITSTVKDNYNNTNSKIEQLSNRITSTVNKCNSLGSKIEQTENRILTEIRDTDNKISAIEQTTESIKTDISNKYEGLNSKITQTANSFSTEIRDTRNDLESKITQTANNFSTEIKNTKGDLESKLEQTAYSLSSTINNKISKCNSRIEQTEDRITDVVDDKISKCNSRIDHVAYGITTQVINTEKDLKSRINQTERDISLVVQDGEVNAGEIALAIKNDRSAINLIADNIAIKPKTGVIEFPNDTSIDSNDTNGMPSGNVIRLRASNKSYLMVNNEELSYYVSDDGGRTSYSIFKVTKDGVFFRGRRIN